MTSGRRARHPLSGISLVVLVSATLVACTPDGGEPIASRDESAFVRPGAPGGGRATASPDPASATPADARFLDGMIRHHEQAVELSALAPGRAGPGVAELAGRVALVQSAEIEAMRPLLDALGGAGDDAHAHDDAMPGQIGSAVFAGAEAAAGDDFDERYLRAMIDHHRGALEMVDERLAEAGEASVSRLARSIRDSQSDELTRMEELLATLP